MTRDVRVDAGPSQYPENISVGPHALVGDEPADSGGADAGPDPYELLLAAHQLSADERAESLLLSRAEVEEGADSLQQLALSTHVFRSARCYASLQYIQAAPD